LLTRMKLFGKVVITKPYTKPICASIGHMVSFEIVIKIFKHCSKNRIPEPLLQTHNLVTKKRKQSK
jgi:deoxyinosine 3'endonuclease (endonuclease V)